MPSLIETVRSGPRPASSRPETAPQRAVADLAIIRLSRGIDSLCEITPPPSDDEQDNIVDAIRSLVRDNAEPALKAIRELVASRRVRLATVERLVGALGYVRGAGAGAAAMILVEVLQRPETVLRAAAIAALSLGADIARAVPALRDAADRESVRALRSAMLQTTDQLEAWATRRAASSKDRSETMG